MLCALCIAIWCSRCSMHVVVARLVKTRSTSNKASTSDAFMGLKAKLRNGHVQSMLVWRRWWLHNRWALFYACGNTDHQWYDDHCWRRWEHSQSHRRYGWDQTASSCPDMETRRVLGEAEDCWNAAKFLYLGSSCDNFWSGFVVFDIET